MASQSWVNLLNAGPPWQTTNGTALTSSASAATISPQAPTGQDFVLPGQPDGLQWYPGMTLRIEGSGTLQAGGTASSLGFWLGAGASGAAVATPGLGATGLLTLGTAVTTAVVWNLHSKLRCVAIGSTGNTLSYGGYISFPTVALANVATLGTANQTILAIPETLTAFNTYTGGTALMLRASLSAAFGSVVCNQFTIEQLC